VAAPRYAPRSGPPELFPIQYARPRPSTIHVMTVTDAPTPQLTAYRVSPWKLSELLPDTREETLAERFAALEAAAEAFESRRQELQPEIAPACLIEILREYEAVIERAWLLSGYASLAFSADTQSRAALALRTRIEEFLTALHNRLLFFTLWWRSLPEERADRLSPSTSERADHQRQGRQRHQRPC
jgi:oligoendopeptidase F